jgi:hypothetical protein
MQSLSAFGQQAHQTILLAAVSIWMASDFYEFSSATDHFALVGFSARTDLAGEARFLQNFW